MKIYSVYDEEFRGYGRVAAGFPTEELMAALARTNMPEKGTGYVAEEPLLQDLPVRRTVETTFFGGLEAEIGWCNGRNTRLNGLEYHCCSEINMGTEDFILMLATQFDREADGTLDSAKVKAFRVPAGVPVEVYATTLHFAPCHVDEAKGFKVMVALLKGTNLAKPADAKVCTADDKILLANNKWLLAHADMNIPGFPAMLKGVNLDLTKD